MENRHPTIISLDQAQASVTNFIHAYMDALKQMTDKGTTNAQDDITIAANVARARTHNHPSTTHPKDEFPMLNKKKKTTQVETKISAQNQANELSELEKKWKAS
eukprot:8289208-Ditylum_brightwellii.AAC.1